MKKIMVTLFFLLSVMIAIAQNPYKLKDTNISFSTSEQLNVVSEKPGYAVFSNSGIQISLSQIRFLAVGGLEKELNRHFPKNEYFITQTNNFSKGDSQHGTFHFADRTGSRLRFAKGLIADGEKTILVEIEYDPAKEEEVNLLVESFCGISQLAEESESQPSTLNPQPEIGSNSNSSSYSTESPILTENQNQSNTPKHPPVNHPNLVTLSPVQKQEFIDAHNKWRAEVGVPPLKWSNDLENYAGEWAIINGNKNCKMQHRSDTDYGENLYWSSGMAFSPKGAVDSWGSEIEDYHGEVVGQEKAMVGHYTQIVWRTTTEVGCAAFKCGEALLVVCNYNPAGNWVGQHPYK